MGIAAGIIGAVVGGGASLIAGGQQARAAESAAEAQAGASEAAIAEQARQYEQTREDFAPWRAAGEAGLAQLQQELGLTGGEMEGIGLVDTPTAGTGVGGAAVGAGEEYIGFDDPTYAGGIEEFYSSDVYQFPLQQGLEAVQSSAAARGLLRSGGTLQGLTQYAQGVAGQAEQTFYNRRQDYLNRGQAAESRIYDRQQDYLNRLGGLAGLGQTSVSQTAAAGQAAASNIGGYLQSAGASRASGILGAGQAQAGTISGIGTALGSILGQL